MTNGDSETIRVERVRKSKAPRPAGLLRFHPLGPTPAMAFYPLKRGSYWIGRADECELHLDDGLASRKHACVERSGGSWTVKDNDSANGLFINGEEVEQAALAGGEVIRVGGSLVRYLAQGTARVPTQHPLAAGELVAGPGFDDVRQLLDRASGSEISVLVTGETGTGKELAARALHDNGPRSQGPFVAVNCSAITAALFESELFGHVKGAFTDAKSDRAGLIRDASGGTLFLDEIGELPKESQAKLLRVLQERKVRPVGGSKPLAVDIRMVCATNRDMAQMVERREFRPDLFARLAEMQIELPPLRARIEDVPLLVRHFVAKHGEPEAVVSVDALEALCCRPWPFNIRELESAVRRALLLADGDELELEHFERAGVAEGSGAGGAAAAAAGEAAAAPGEATAAAEAPGDNPQADRMREALREHAGDADKVGEALGLSRSQVYRRAKKYGIVISNYRP